MKTLKDKIEKIRKEEGFNSISDFVENYMKKGNFFSDFRYFLGTEYGLFYSDRILRGVIGKELDFEIREMSGKNRKKKTKKLKMKRQLNLVIAKEEGYSGIIKREIWTKKANALGFFTVSAAMIELEKKYLQEDVAKLFNTTHQNYSYRKKKMRESERKFKV